MQDTNFDPFMENYYPDFRNETLPPELLVPAPLSVEGYHFINLTLLLLIYLFC